MGKALRLSMAVLLFMNAAAQPPERGGHGGHGGSMESMPRPAPRPKASAEAKKGTTPGARSEEPRAPVEIPREQQARIGLQSSRIGLQPVEQSVRTVGVIAADETREARIHSRLNGWIERIFVDSVGKPVKKGQALFELYSPELVSTQEEYLAARNLGAAGREVSQAALDRLRFWGVPESEIETLKNGRKVKRALRFDSPVDGYVVSKNAIQGMYVSPQMELYYIADLSVVWNMVTLYEYDVATIQVGDRALIELPYSPGKTYSGTIRYIYPEVERETRTVRARVEIPNPEGVLKPGMFTNVEIKKNLGEAIVVPDDSVIDTGVRRIVFVKVGGTRFEPREIRIGPRVGNQFIVLAGLKPGEEVVTGAHFLIDAESKLQAALQKSSPPPAGHSGHGA